MMFIVVRVDSNHAGATVVPLIVVPTHTLIKRVKLQHQYEGSIVCVI